MKKKNLESLPADFYLAHKLINQLSIIVGNCALIKEELPRDSEHIKRLTFIQDTARSMAAELKKKQKEFGILEHAV
jgi:hypothetical protein